MYYDDQNWCYIFELSQLVITISTEIKPCLVQFVILPIVIVFTLLTQLILLYQRQQQQPCLY